MSSAIRFEVTFELLSPHDLASYVVCSVHGEGKAIVIATQKHATAGKGHILSVQVAALPGDKPQGSDLVDRMEW